MRKSPKKRAGKQKQLETGHVRVSQVALHYITPSPENDQLYRPVNRDDPAVQELAQSIRENGLLEPLVVTRDGYIISGHRRHAAAIVAGLTEVPVRYEDFNRADDLDRFIRLLREHNRQRDKTLDERLREELVSVNPAEAYYSLIEHRDEAAHVDVETMQLRPRKRRSQITAAKKPFLDAALRVLEERRRYWPLSVRTIHYALLNFSPLKHASKPLSRYRNDLKSYKSLDELLTRARIEEIIPLVAIGDDTRPVTTWAVHPNPRGIIRTELDGFMKNYWRDLLQSQPNHIEIICEKNTVEPVLRKVAMKYTIPLTSGRGYCSVPPRYQMAQRYEKSGKRKLIVLALSDFDADGLVIAESFARSMRDDFGIDKIVPVRVGLTREQIDEIDDPPTALAPKTGSANYKSFVAAHGTECWELEAIPPDDLQQILRDAIDCVLDVNAFNAELDAEKEDAAYLSGVRTTVHDTLQQIDFE